VCDVYINGSFVKRLKRFPTGANDFATFKVNRILEDYLSYDLKNNLYGTSLFSKNNASLLEYELKFGEEYDASAQCDAGTTVFPNLTSTNSLFSPTQDFSAFNGALQKKEWLLWDDQDYTAIDSTSKFLTRMPEQALITEGSQLTFNIFNDDIRKLRVKTYDEFDNLIATYTYANTFFSVSNQLDRLLIIGVGPENLNNSTLLTGTQPVIEDSVSYYTVQLLKTADAVCSEEKRIDIDHRFSNYTPHRIWFLGRLGGFDSYTYTLKSTRRIDTSRNEFKHIYGAFRNDVPDVWDYNMKDRGRTTLSVNGQVSEVWNSNWLTENEALWMEELFTSIEVYEQSLNFPICFPYVIVIEGVGPGALLIQIPITVGEIGDEIILYNNLYPELNDTFIIIDKNEDGIIIAYPFIAGYALGPLDQSAGTFLLLGFDGELLPLIFRTNSWDEKIKKNIKNINYFIEVEDAEQVNTQRN
jgi:hypothetical protein